MRGLTGSVEPYTTSNFNNLDSAVVCTLNLYAQGPEFKPQFWMMIILICPQRTEIAEFFSPSLWEYCALWEYCESSVLTTELHDTMTGKEEHGSAIGGQNANVRIQCNGTITDMLNCNLMTNGNEYISICRDHHFNPVFAPSTFWSIRVQEKGQNKCFFSPNTT